MSHSRLFAIFMSAVLILNQAAFLFTPINPAYAQEGDAVINLTLTNPANDAILPDNAAVQVEVETNISDIAVELCWSGSNMDCQPMSYQSGNTYIYNWDTTALSDGDYKVQVQARDMYSTDSVKYYSDEVLVKTRTTYNNTITKSRVYRGFY